MTILTDIIEEHRREVRVARTRGATGVVFDAGIPWTPEQVKILSAHMEREHGYHPLTFSINIERYLERLIIKPTLPEHQT